MYNEKYVSLIFIDKSHTINKCSYSVICYYVKKYCMLILPKNHRSALCKFRCGGAPLRLETGRYEGLPVNRRTCVFCSHVNIDTVEN